MLEVPENARADADVGALVLLGEGHDSLQNPAQTDRP
jgi:hypothetical protein